MELRLATPKDSDEILAIYKPYVETTTITFEYDVPSSKEFCARVQNISQTMPYIVMVDKGKIVGYGYASRYRERKAYDWAVELSIYVEMGHKNKGIGTKIYTALINVLKQLGYCRVYACITSPNPASVAFHKKYGFRDIGIFHKVGYKFNTWLDIVWMELDMNPDNHNIHTPYTIIELSKECIATCLSID